MRKLILLLPMAFLLMGCCGLMCPSTCDDGNPCTRDHCGMDTMGGCAHEPIDGSQPGCSEVIGACRQNLCDSGTCTSFTLNGCCGNGRCEARETLDTCAMDCPLDIGTQCDYPSALVPAFAQWAIVSNSSQIYCNVTNSGGAEADFTLSAEIPGWTSRESVDLTLAPGETQENVGLMFTSFTDRFYSNSEVTDATLVIKVERGNATASEFNQNVKMQAKGDMIWTVDDADDMAPLVIMWVTPHDPCIDSVLTLAKEKMPGRSLSGYIGYDDLSEEERTARTKLQAKALYNAVKDVGISYVSTTLSFAPMYAQRVKLPYESVEQRSGNCIDGAVLFASLFESLEMEPIIIIVPGHAFVGVRSYPDTNEFVFIETTMVGTSSFEDAQDYGDEEFTENLDAGTLEYYYVKDYREIGITPFPLAGRTLCNLQLPSCPDGTISGSCSRTKPQYCEAGTLVDKASQCGCPTGSLMDGDECVAREQLIYNQSFSVQPYYTHYYGGYNTNTGTLETLHYIVNSDMPVDIHVVPTESDYDSLAYGGAFNHYPSCYMPNALTYDNTCTGSNKGGIAITNNNDYPATVRMVAYRVAG